MDFDVELPQGETLDGELFHSRDNFNNTVSIVRSHNSDKWDEIRFQVSIPSFPCLFFLPFLYLKRKFSSSLLQKKLGIRHSFFR